MHVQVPRRLAGMHRASSVVCALQHLGREVLQRREEIVLQPQDTVRVSVASTCAPLRCRHCVAKGLAEWRAGSDGWSCTG
jgi:hypothetical protein